MSSKKAAAAEKRQMNEIYLRKRVRIITKTSKLYGQFARVKTLYRDSGGHWFLMLQMENNQKVGGFLLREIELYRNGIEIMKTKALMHLARNKINAL